MPKHAVVGRGCVARGTCAKACPFSAMSVPDGRFAVVDENLCIGCGTCAKVCPAEVISI
ncbi:4Fe-4S binding protein [Slackia sp.]|uniref:4Fe-4S binding protein n=1 Tax=Slackia sp. TaxID=2049041 RepID=UPI002E783A21|nr:4Fe-4S binding protein [Slackia sp.]MEE0518225.1 4Fe-4S binding protein [Slackia sp.]